MMTLLVEIKTNIAIAQAAGETSLTLTQIADFERCYQEIIEAGYSSVGCAQAHFYGNSTFS